MDIGRRRGQKEDSPQVLPEIANGTRDLLSFVEGERYDGLLETTPDQLSLLRGILSFFLFKPEDRICTYDETNGDPLPCRNAMRGPIPTCFHPDQHGVFLSFSSFARFLTRGKGAYSCGTAQSRPRTLAIET